MPDDRPKLLRVALVTQTGSLPAWQVTLRKRLQTADFIDLDLVTASESQPAEPAPPALFAAWARLEARVLRSKVADVQYLETQDPMTGVDVPDIPRQARGADELGAVLRQSAPDVVIWLLTTPPEPALLDIARLGIWAPGGMTDASFGVRELLDNHDVTTCLIVRYGATREDDAVIASAATATDRLSLVRGRTRIRAITESLLLRTLNRALHGRLDDDGKVESDTVEGSDGPGRAPRLSAIHLAPKLGALYGRYFRRLVQRPFVFDQWQLAFRRGGDRLQETGFKVLAPGHNGFWADPFVIEREGETWVIFEEYSCQTGRGHIAALELRPDGSHSEPIQILARPYHLSYPFLLEHDGELFMIPEAAESGRVEAYRCEQFPGRWAPHAVLLDGVNALDPTIVEHDGRWWMYATMQRGTGWTDDELHLFYADAPFGPWTSHPLNPVCLDVRAARPAGALFRRDGRLFRPAQDCSARYGWAISIREVLQMSTDDYREVPVKTMLPEHVPQAAGTHTINQAGGVTVRDFEVRRRRTGAAGHSG